MQGSQDASVMADIDELLEMPGLASVKRLATALANSVMGDLPDPSAVDAAQLFRKCARIVALAEHEAFEKAKPEVRSKDFLIRALEKRLLEIEGDFWTLTDEKAALLEIAVEQDKLIMAQRKVLEAAVDGGAFREFRLPH